MGVVSHRISVAAGKSLGSSRMGKRGLCLALDESRKKQTSKPKDSFSVDLLSVFGSESIWRVYRNGDTPIAGWCILVYNLMEIPLKWII